MGFYLNKKMDDHLSIFDDIYSIKDNISDEIFLTLNNKIQKLIADLQSYKNRANLNIEDNSDEESELGSPISINSYDDHHDYIFQENNSNEIIYISESETESESGEVAGVFPQRQMPEESEESDESKDFSESESDNDE